MCGVEEGVRRMFAEAQVVLRGENILAEHFLRREPEEELIRLYCASAMMCSVVYICDNSYVAPLCHSLKKKLWFSST